MKRRDFIAWMSGSGAAVAWSRVARAQQAGKTFKVGVLWHAGSAQEEGPYFAA